MVKSIQKRHNIVHLGLSVLFLCSSFSVVAQTQRAPANYVPDDDMIVVPITVERNFYDEFNEKHKDRFRKSRQRLEGWITQEQYARDHGLEDAGFIHIPTSAQKQQFFERNYVRFIKKDIQRSNKETLKDFRDSWRAEDELDSIRNNEQRNEYIVLSKKSRGQAIASASKTIKLGKKKFKFSIQPRLESGMVRIKLKTDYIYVRAWLGVNGRQELYLDKKFKSTGTRLEANYYIDENRILAAAHQRINDNWNLRLTHQKIADSSNTLIDSSQRENNILSVNFGMGF